jgi:hypothetical protein
MTVQDAANALLAALPVGGGVSSIVQAFQSAYNAADGSPHLAVDGRWGPNTSLALSKYGTVPPFGSLGPAAPGQFLPSVMAAFQRFTGPLEGAVPYMYQDTAGWVTVGYGNKVDPVGDALAVPGWLRNGQAATPAEVSAAWSAVKSNTDLNLRSVKAKGIAGNDVYLSQAGMDALRNAKLRSMISVVASTFPNVLSWPADAQLGLLGVVWGSGPYLQNLVGRNGSLDMRPFVTAIRANDFEGMTRLASSWGPGGNWYNLNPDRKAQLILLFSNAANVAQRGLDYTLLNWPAPLTVRGVVKGAAIGAGIYVAGGLGFLAAWTAYEFWKNR